MRNGNLDGTLGPSTGEHEQGEVTLLLREWTQGKTEAGDRLFEMVYPELHRVAVALFRGERANSNLMQPTGVVNDLFLRLVRHRSLRFEDRQHFYSFSARIMRRVLIDDARQRHRMKRDGGLRVPLDEKMAWIDAKDVEYMDLERVLEELAAADPRKLKIVELRLFLGFTSEETAELLDLSNATVDREMKFVRGWMYERLHPVPAQPAQPIPQA